MEEKTTIFADGFIFKRAREGAPEFVKGSLSIKVEEAKAFLDKHNNDGWVNLDLLKSQKNTLYLKLNDWKPTKEDFKKGAESFDDFAGSLKDTGAEALKKKLAEQEYPVEYPENPNPDDLPF